MLEKESDVIHVIMLDKGIGEIHVTLDEESDVIHVYID